MADDQLDAGRPREDALHELGGWRGCPRCRGPCRRALGAGDGRGVRLRRGGRRPSTRRCRSSGSSTENVRALARRSLLDADACRPSPRPGPATAPGRGRCPRRRVALGAEALERREQPLEVARARCRGPVSVTRCAAAGRRRARSATRPSPPGAVVLDRVRQQVEQDLLAGAGGRRARTRQPARASRLRRARCRARPRAGARGRAPRSAASQRAPARATASAARPRCARCRAPR